MGQLLLVRKKTFPSTFDQPSYDESNRIVKNIQTPKELRINQKREGAFHSYTKENNRQIAFQWIVCTYPCGNRYTKKLIGDKRTVNDVIFD